MNTVANMVLMPIGELHPYENNARVHSDEQIEELRKSMREFGFVAPILASEDGTVIAGHGRLRAAELEGVEEVPVVIVEHLTETQRRAYILADNRLAEHASWDDELVSIELRALSDAGFDISVTGFDFPDVEIEPEREICEDDYDEDECASCRVKRGDVWKLGRHRLMCGDATSASDIQTLTGGGTVQLLLTDPPYNVNVTGGTDEHLKIENDNMENFEFLSFLEGFLTECVKVLEPGASFYIWHADGDSAYEFRAACRHVGLKVRQCLIWLKNCAVLSRQDYHWQHEPCLHGEVEALECGDDYNEHEACIYGWKDGASHRWCSDRKQTTVLSFDKPNKSAEHPTMKPVKLFAYQIANSTLPDARVLDPFAGSGTTVIACEQLGRSAYAMELSEHYADVIIDRWEKFTGEKAVKL